MSSSLFEEAINLQRAAHELMYLGMDGMRDGEEPGYSGLFYQSGKVHRM